MRKQMRFTAVSQMISLSLLIYAGNAIAEDIDEVDMHSSIETAQNIDGYFTMGDNPDIQDSTIMPWVSILGTGNGSNDYYRFEVQGAGDTGIFDVDYAMNSGGYFDSELCLFDSEGNLLASNDDSGVEGGANDSFSYRDSFIEHTFADAGTYVIAVGEYNVTCNTGGMYGNTLDAGDTYELQVSLTQTVISDSDGDGIADEDDCNPDSDLNPTVVFEGCDSGVGNTVYANGCSIADHLHACSDDAVNKGQAMKCVTALTSSMKKSGEITGLGKGMIQRCAAQSGMGK